MKMQHKFKVKVKTRLELVLLHPRSETVYRRRNNLTLIARNINYNDLLQSAPDTLPARGGINHSSIYVCGIFNMDFK